MDENPYRGPASDAISGTPKGEKGPLFTLVGLLTVLGIVGLVIALLLPARRGVSEAARRSQCVNNLKQIGLALHNYEAIHGALPPAYTTDANGKPLHSWRTLILPFLEEQQLYETIDLTKPWDDPVNAEAFKTRVPAYQCPSVPELGQPGRENRTTYLAVSTPNSCFRPSEPRSLSEIADDARYTLTVIEVDSEHAVPWMSPVDADEKVVMGMGPESKLPHPGGMNAAFVDGSVRFLEAEMPASQLRALISIAGNDNAAAEGAD